MLVLIVVGALSASMPDTVTRVPGTRLRLGMAEARLLDLGAFAEVKATDAPGMTARHGDTKFFGVPCQATFYFRGGRLARVRFQATGASPRALDYVEDQLRRLRMRRECARYELGVHVCDWRGESVQVHLEVWNDQLTATVEPWPPPPEAEPSTGDVEPAGTAAAAGEGSAGTGATLNAGAGEDSAGAGAAPVATLPETLMISLVSRNSPTDWPRVVSSPPIDYPESAGRENVEGVVWVLALVDADGRVRSATVERGIPALDEAAVAWVSRARFAPCERQGQPCGFHVRIAVRFALP